MYRRAILAGFAASCLLAGSPVGAGPRDEAALRGARYIVERQTSTGAFFDTDTAADTVAEAVVALVAGGVVGAPVDDALGYIALHGPDRATGRAGWAGRLVMGLAAAGADPRSFETFDYVAALRGHYDAATGAFETNVYANALALLGLAAAGEDVPAEAIRFVKVNQCAEGGFSWQAGCAGRPDVDTTAHTTSALLAAGVGDADLAVSRARSWLERTRNPDGGFPLEQGQPTNANSTSLAVSAIAALGEDPQREPWSDGDADPVAALAALQDPSSGGFRWKADQRQPNDYSTVQAVVGIAGRTWPVLPARSEAPDRAVDAQPRATPPTSPARVDPTPAPAAANRPPDDGGSQRAGVVVRFADGTERRECVTFTESEISGYELLRRTQLDIGVETADFGVAICRIGGDGCTDDCFCQYPVFWGYWTRDTGQEAWSFSQVGAGDRPVRDGSLDGWVFGKDGEPAPPEVALDEVCAAAPAPPPGEDVAQTASRTNVAVAIGVSAALLGSGVALTWRRRRIA